MAGSELRDVTHRVFFVLAISRKVSQVGNASVLDQKFVGFDS